MVHLILGSDKFQEGLALYMKRHEYGNTVTADLWQAWAKVSGKDIPSIMSTWTEQMGFPLVKVEQVEGAEGGKLKLKFTQSWFLADGSFDAEKDEDKVWTIPLAIQVGGQEGQPHMLMMDQRECVLEVPGAADAWVKVNYGQDALCRVNYTPGLLERLSGAIRRKELPAKDRAALLSDAVALSKVSV